MLWKESRPKTRRRRRSLLAGRANIAIGLFGGRRHTNPEYVLRISLHQESKTQDSRVKNMQSSLHEQVHKPLDESGTIKTPPHNRHNKLTISTVPESAHAHLTKAQTKLEGIGGRGGASSNPRQHPFPSKKHMIKTSRCHRYFWPHAGQTPSSQCPMLPVYHEKP